MPGGSTRRERPSTSSPSTVVIPQSRARGEICSMQNFSQRSRVLNRCATLRRRMSRASSTPSTSTPQARHRLDDHGDRKTPEAKPLRLVIFGGIVFGEVGVVDVEPFLHRIAVPLCHRHKDRPCIRALWPKHEVYTAKNSLLRPRQSVVVLGHRAHHEQGSEELRGRSKSTRPAHPDEHDQVEKCRWAELGELDFVQLQH